MKKFSSSGASRSAARVFTSAGFVVIMAVAWSGCKGSAPGPKAGEVPQPSPTPSSTSTPDPGPGTPDEVALKRDDFNILFNGSKIADDSGEIITLPSVEVEDAVPLTGRSREFVIQNGARLDLQLVSATVTPANAYEIINTPDAMIGINKSTTVAIAQKTQRRHGARSGRLTLVFGDTEDARKQVHVVVQFIGVVRAKTGGPEIVVLQEGSIISGGTRPTTFNFGSVNQTATNQSARTAEMFTIFNVGATPMKLTRTAAQKSALGTGFALASNATLPDSVTIAAGTGRGFGIVVKDTTNVGNLTANLAFTTDATNEKPEFKFPIKAAVIEGPQIAAYLRKGTQLSPLCDAGKCSANSPVKRVEFADAVRGDTASAIANVFVVKNLGKQPLALSQVTLPAGFVIAKRDDLEKIVQPGSSASMSLVLDVAANQKLGEKKGEITIKSNDINAADQVFTIPVIGELQSRELEVKVNGVNNALRDGQTNAIEFASLNDIKVFTLKNTGTAEISISSLRLSNGSFILREQPNGAFKIAAGRTATFKVALKSGTQATAEYRATLTISSNDEDANERAFTVPVHYKSK